MRTNALQNQMSALPIVAGEDNYPNPKFQVGDLSAPGTARLPLYRASLVALGLLALTPVVQAQTGAVSRRGRHALHPVATGANRANDARLASLSGSANNTVSNIGVVAEEDGTRFIITGSDPFTPVVFTAPRMGGTVITVPGHWNTDAPANGEAETRQVDSNGITHVSFESPTRGPQRVRIVAYATGRLAYSVQSTPDRRHWEVKVWSPGVAASDITLTASPIAPDTRPVVVPTAAPAPTAPVLVNNKPAGSATVSTATSKITSPAKVAALPNRQVVSGRTGTFFATHSVAQPTAHPVMKIKPNVRPAVVASRIAIAPAPVQGVRVAQAVGVYPNLVKQGTKVADTAASATRARQDLAEAMDKRVSLDFIAADINDVLKALSLQSGINIVTGADVKGNITVSLNRVPVTEALEMVTRLSGFQYARFQSAIVVGTPASVATIVSSSNASEPITEFIPYRFTSPAVVTTALLDRFPGLNIKADANNTVNPAYPRLLVLTDKKERVAEARDFVERLEQAVSVPTLGATTEVYRVRYANANELVQILTRLVPTITVQLGPSQGFQSGSSGASASYVSNPPTGGGPVSGSGTGNSTGGSSSTGGSGPTNPAGATSSGNEPRSLLLSGSAADIARAREVLAQVDIKTATLMYEARVMDLANSDILNLGLTYDFTNGQRGINIGERDTNTDIINNNAPYGGRVPKFGAIFRTPYSIGINLQALANNNRSRVLASPNLAAIDGQPATVFIGDQIKYVTNVQVTTTGTTIQTETAQVGVTLKVTGKSSPDGSITLFVHPEVSSVTQFLTLSNGVSLPQIATRYVDTTIRVKDGETIAIGGLIRETDIKNIQKVPFLGDIPFFGQLFRRTNTTKDRSEVVIFITSRIAKD